MNTQNTARHTLQSALSIRKEKVMAWTLLVVAVVVFVTTTGICMAEQHTNGISEPWFQLQIAGCATAGYLLAGVYMFFTPKKYKRMPVDEGFTAKLVASAKGHDDIIDEIETALNGDRGLYQDDLRVIEQEVARREERQRKKRYVDEEARLVTRFKRKKGTDERPE